MVKYKITFVLTIVQLGTYALCSWNKFHDNYCQLWTATRSSINAQSALYESKARSSLPTQAKAQVKDRWGRARRKHKQLCIRRNDFVSISSRQNLSLRLCLCYASLHWDAYTNANKRSFVLLALALRLWLCLCFACPRLSCAWSYVCVASGTRLNNNATSDESPFDNTIILQAGYTLTMCNTTVSSCLRDFYVNFF